MPPRNVLLFYCDELRADALGCCGNRWFTPRTPHLDWIASQGVRFSHHFCNSPVCVPSRTCGLTGLYCEDTGVYHNEAAWPHYCFAQDCQTVPGVFADHGFRTANFGKIHLPRGMPCPFQHHDPEGGEMGFGHGIDEETLGLIAPPGVPTQIGGAFPGDRPYPPEKVVDNALAWMAQDDTPFFARLSFLQPHTPVFPPPPWSSMYDGEAFPECLEERGAPSDFERRFARTMEAHKLAPRQVYLACVYYFGLVSWLDNQVGRVLDWLRARNALEETLLVFTADHGASLGENGCYAKHTFAPQVHRVPFLIAQPGSLPEHDVCAEISEGVDLSRTLFARCGIDAPAQFKGRDMLADPAPDAVYATIGYGFPDSKAFPNLGKGEFGDGHGWPRRSCIRTARYRYDRNVRLDGRPVDAADVDPFLADVRDDPEEMVNRAGDPAYADTLAQLDEQLLAHVQRGVEIDPAMTRR